jgi:hypothetical protein
MALVRASVRCNGRMTIDLFAGLPMLVLGCGCEAKRANRSV